MDDLSWLRKKFGKNKKGWQTAACPFLIDNQCSIYEKRFSCCRNFPRQGKFYCSDSDCKILKKGVMKNSKKGTVTCVVCRDNCCSQILVPKNIRITKGFFRRLMDISCQDCQKFFGSVTVQ